MYGTPRESKKAGYLKTSGHQAMFRSSLETSNIGRAAGVCCVAVVCRVTDGPLAFIVPFALPGCSFSHAPIPATRHTTAKQQTPAARPMFEIFSDDLNMA